MSATARMRRASTASNYCNQAFIHRRPIRTVKRKGVPVDHIQFPYRSSSHLGLMHVINESRAWERNGLVVDFDKIISRGDAHELVPKGEVEFVSGNHVSTYAARAKGDTWAYLGQTVSRNNLALITRPDIGIDKLEDVRGRKFGNRGRHTGLNTWLYL